MSYHHKSGALKPRERKRAIEAHTEVMSKTVKLTDIVGKQRLVTVTEQMLHDDPSTQSAAVPEAISHSQDVGNVENNNDKEIGSKFGNDVNGPNQFVDALELDAVAHATDDNKSDVYIEHEDPTIWLCGQQQLLIVCVRTGLRREVNYAKTKTRVLKHLKLQMRSACTILLEGIFYNCTQA